MTAASVSVIVPAYDEEESLPEVARRVLDAIGERWPDHQLVLVDDGSRDKTWAVITALAAADPSVCGVRLVRNFGQTPALCAGFAASRGDIVVTIDADLDTDPADIPRLVEMIEGGAVYVSGRREARDWHRGVPSRLFNVVARSVGSPYLDLGCGMMAMSSGLAAEALHHGELRRGFRIKVLLASLAGGVTEIPVRSGPRTVSRHRAGDLLSGGFEVGVPLRRTAFLRVAAFGAAVGVVGGLGLLACLVWALTGGGASAGWAALDAAMIALLGCVLAVTGIAVNLLLRNQHQSSTPFVRVAETVGDVADPGGSGVPGSG